MDDKTQKERLEQELKFLMESFEAEVISKDEFEKGKDRIEKKLKEIRQSEQKSNDEKPKEEQKKEEAKADESIMHKEGEKIILRVIQEDEHNEHFEPVQTKIAEEKAEPLQEPKKEVKEKKDGKFFKYAVVFVVLLLAVFFLYSTFKGLKEKTEPIKAAAESKASKINVLVVNDRKNCFNCDTERVIAILESWFGALNAKETGYNTDEGKSIAEKFDAKLLPLYILDENITKKQSFEQFKKVFVKKDNAYVLNENTAGSTFYFRRENIPNKLDLFVKSGDEASIKAEKNLQEFLENFKDAKFQKHSSEGNLTKELGIKTFPTFLINNRVKFSGVHTAETIKENFCRLNKIEACEKSLGKSLV